MQSRTFPLHFVGHDNDELAGQGHPKQNLPTTSTVSKVLVTCAHNSVKWCTEYSERGIFVVPCQLLRTNLDRSQRKDQG